MEEKVEEFVVLDRFVVLEGLDGAGTTTQLRFLDERLSSAGIRHFCTGEPTGGTIGQMIREILKRRVQVEPQTVALLFAADRSEHLHQPQEGILARLKRGELVISDRYLFSSLAYQSLGCPFEYVWELNRLFPLPRLTLFVDTPVVESQQRLVRRRGAGGSNGTTSAAPGTRAAPGYPSAAGPPSTAGPPVAAGAPSASGELFDGAEIQDNILAAYERAFALFDGSPMEVRRVDGSEGSQQVFENLWKILKRLPILRG